MVYSLRALMIVSFIIWIFSILSFLGASFLLQSGANGLYTNSQSFIIAASAIVGCITFILFAVTFIFEFAHKIKFMFSKMIIVFLMIGMWALGWVSVRAYDAHKPAHVSLSTPTTTKSMFIQINEERQKHDIKPVIFDEKLSTAAGSKACDMKERNYFSHQDPQGRWGWHFLRENNVHYQNAGENLAQDEVEPDPDVDMRGFMNSPEHRAIILDPQYTSVGYASCGVYTVQYFVN